MNFLELHVPFLECFARYYKALANREAGNDQDLSCQSLGPRGSFGALPTTIAVPKIEKTASIYRFLYLFLMSAVMSFCVSESF